MLSRFLFSCALLACSALVFAVPPTPSNIPKQEPNRDAQDAAKKASVEGNLKIKLWAAEPLLSDPVAFDFDEKGRCYIAETTRFKHGVPDTRDHMYWLDEDIANRTTDDLLAMYKKHNFGGYEEFSDQLRMVWDKDGDDVAESSSIFSGGYNRPQDGLAAGVLARHGKVYFSCIPSLYLLKDTNDDQKADVKEVLSTGYGARAQFLGHDLHGLLMGPDGKLYFSIGDRGVNVTNMEGKKVESFNSGCVLRCDPDGKNLEIVHRGLRNPQELAFDNYGNMFTYDNNSDSGDQARWVQIVEGGDSGWRCGYQYGTLMHNETVPQGNRGPWNTERIWEIPTPDQPAPAYIVPPLLHFGNGPSGLTHYPGIGLNDKYQDHFFACDFTANPSNSKIWTLAVKPKGASYEVTDLHPFVQNMVPTDCDFAPDGAFYWLDWVGGWDVPHKGRIFRVTDEAEMTKPIIAETEKLLASDFSKKSIAELAKLLEHPHQKVRLEAQYALADMGINDAEALDTLVTVAQSDKSVVTRLHAIWGLGSIGRTTLSVVKYLLPLAESDDAIIRANIATALGHPDYSVMGLNAVRAVSPMPALTKLLTDSDPHVRAKAAASYGKVALQVDGPVTVNLTSEQVKYQPLFDLLKSNADADAYIRQAAVEGLVQATRNPVDLLNYWKSNKDNNDVPAVRLGVLLALRRMNAKQMAEFLNDVDTGIVTEAARGIYDESVEAAYPSLALLAEKSNLPEFVAYRALAANYKLGQADNAARVAEFATRETEKDYLRVFAVKLLEDWLAPPRLDPITGLTQELDKRDGRAIVEAVKPSIPKLFTGSDELRSESLKLVKTLGITDVGPLMLRLLKDQGRSDSVRVEALFAMQSLKAKELQEGMEFALKSDKPRLRASANVVKARANPEAATQELPKLLNNESATIIEKQMALDVLGELKASENVDKTLDRWLDKLLQNNVAPELKLDLLQASQARATAKDLKLHADLRDKLAKVDAMMRAAEATDPLARYRDVVAGGDAEAGKKIFLNNAAVYCQRCHKLNNVGGEVGPVLDGIASKEGKTRDYLLRSIVDPNADIAEGYQSVLIYTLDGVSISGVLRSKDDKEVTIITADNKVVKIPIDDIDAQQPDKSAMPADLHKKLTRSELRDVVEFLSSLK